jgi:hypothetical protein
VSGRAGWGQAPCGTLSAARRHYRRGEKPCEACIAAQRRRWAERRGTAAGNQSPDYREIRNGLPFRPYVYRGTGVDQLESAS